MVGSVADEEVDRESARPEDVWLVQPEEVQQGLRHIEEQRLQEGGEAHVVFSDRQQQQFVQQPLQDNTVSSTTPDL